MPPNTPEKGAAKLADVLAEARRERQRREKGYREQALKLFPHICGRCGREFAGKRLRELTVHHRDHDHDNNPPDGSNWELLCLYCHENEHARDQVADAYDGHTREDTGGGDSAALDNPFAVLKDLLKEKP
ncbi:MAG: YajD family HNH nuclease [Desulfosarcinaceae bacterium]|nr:YajD family HNH nuclease [Desulfosarcinaceae bacterium]